MAIDVEQLALQIYIATVSPGILQRVFTGQPLDNLYRRAAEQSLLAAEEFERVSRAAAVA